MALNDRSQKILNEIASNRQITSGTLEQKYKLTRRQLGYTIEKINDWLQAEGLAEIERTRQGRFIVDQSVFSKLVREDVPVQKTEQGFLTEEQRVHLILFMLLTSEEELSLLHFHSELGYSKNTVLNDLKQVQVFVDAFELTVRYSRRSGYLLEGKELQIRKLLIYLVESALQMQDGQAHIEKIATVVASEVQDFQKRIERVEEKLGIQFTDEKLAAMPYIFMLILKRIERSHVLDPFPIEYEELSDTKEYQATEYIFHHIVDVPKQERFFIALHLLAANVHWSLFMSEDEALPDLMPTLSTMVQLFERSACIYFQERELLLKKLVQHIKPAYYRIKYQLTAIEPVETPFSMEYRELHHLVKRSLGPLETLFGKTIPEAEAMYVTMLIGSWMTRQGESIDKKVKAIVVCPQGVSVSRLMLKELTELFPEFIFLDSLSVRQFQTYDLSYDLVFSQTPLETSKSLYITKAILGKEEKYRLKQQVMQDVHGYKPKDINLDHLIDMVKRHATLANESGLRDELYHYFFPDSDHNRHSHHSAEGHSLHSFLYPEMITRVSSTPTWETALEHAAEPLVAQGMIEQRYVDALKRDKERDPYIIIGPHLAIPHAAPEEGVLKTGMSLLQLEEPVQFSDDEWIHLIIVIAAKDKHQHIRALRQLIKLAGSGNDRVKLQRAQSKTEMMEIIDFYSMDEE
ncbi:transcriptional antiterminator/mannitol/fructose-specific phosphotransferase system IIA component (Ntr-type) [Alkalihalobacillus xiaoxiensis]|uniref:Ascorbate-specific PTS system EIIA component n=1 Tax=Shouchella xiaoxiensis TaxID=766895 RepID=A0ABS2SS90_9BACI|nr:BglG family transcription antiterminator [Shouchella xiaoxiensis]MBM7837147.1 transcriptional antiterminator/mannitol/fructose-specific phosphotransferase system IIA component (Ntr-type) [Shouchella xiaoxiensis]